MNQISMAFKGWWWLGGVKKNSNCYNLENEKNLSKITGKNLKTNVNI
jgi:hypothetical protein